MVVFKETKRAVPSASWLFQWFVASRMSLSAVLSTLLTQEIINDSAVMKDFFDVAFWYLGHWKERRML